MDIDNENNIRYFNTLRGNSELLSKDKLLHLLSLNGIVKNDPRIQDTIEKLVNLDIEHPLMDYDTFIDCIEPSIVLLDKVFGNKLIIPDFKDFTANIKVIYDKIKLIKEGNVADYIPQLARVDPDKLGISITTIDGQQYSIGDTKEYFCVQSCCKPINYAMALEEHGMDIVHHYVGREPSGRSFNELALNKYGKPHNPLINSGAIMTCSLIKNKVDRSVRFDYVLDKWKHLSGNSAKVGFSNSTYLSEKNTADRNYALAYFMRETNDSKPVGFPENTEINDILEFYFQCCSIELNCYSLSIVASTFANGGICPITNEKVLEPETVRNCLSLMYSCGMYDYSGEFAFTIGLPAKSGVAGAIMIVIPGIMGVCVWSPNLDSHGNSVRGVEFCKQLCEIFNFHQYDNVIPHHNKIDPRASNHYSEMDTFTIACYAAAKGDLHTITSLYMSGNDLTISDYDGRTPLHLACSEGKIEIVKYLVDIGKCPIDIKDRWNNTPIDDCIRENHIDIKEYLEKFNQLNNCEL